MKYIKPFHCYRIAGRRPIVVESYRRQVDGTGYISVTGYTVSRWKRWVEFHTYDDSRVSAGDYRTNGDAKGLAYPRPTEFRFRPSSKVVEVEL